MSAASESPPGLRVHRAVLLVSFGVSIALLLSLAYRFDEYVRPLSYFVVALVAMLWSLPTLARRRLPIDWVLAAAAVNLLLVVPELSLRFAGFRYESGIQFGYPRPIRMVAFEPDADLFWRLRTSEPDVNSLGFPGKEIAQPKPEGTFRMLFLGDSCTYQGYSSRTEAILSRRSPASLTIEAVNLGVPGYSSHQGRILAEMYADVFEPDLVFAYFGWNDHWLAYGAVDAEKVVDVPQGILANPFYRGLVSLRILQLGRKLLRAADTEISPLAEVRVPLEDYRRNLRSMRSAFARRNVPIVFVTAPSAHRSRGVPAYLLELKFARDLRSVVQLHDRYVETTREVAAEGGRSALLDLAFAIDDEKNADAIFREDGIHFTDAGLEWVAERFAEAALPYLSAGDPAGSP